MSKVIKLQEVSRNELLAKSKKQTITRYNKSAGYKGFSIVDIDTTSVLTTDSLRVTCRVGDYWDTVELEDILYWVQFYAEQNPNNQINTKVVTKAIMDAIDAMTIKVDCSCPDFIYRFAYMATKLGYKYGKPETRPAKITNPNDYGSMCKHLIAMLSNKKWLQQVTATFMDFLEKRIEEVNRYLRVKFGEELTLPNEQARQMAKQGAYTKWANRLEQLQDVANKYIEARANYILNADVFHITEDIKNWVNQNYKDSKTGVDYLKLKQNEVDVLVQEVLNYKEENTKEQELPEEEITDEEQDNINGEGENV